MPQAPLRASILLVVGLAVLTACGGAISGEPSANGSTSSTGAGKRLPVALTEFAIATKSTLTAGTYTFVVEENGQAPHALSISGPGVDTQSTVVLDPGDPPTELTVTLESGTYTLWCPVGSHRQQGMEATVTVS